MLFHLRRESAVAADLALPSGDLPRGKRMVHAVIGPGGRASGYAV